MLKPNKLNNIKIINLPSLILVAKASELNPAKTTLEKEGKYVTVTIIQKL